jgi:TolB-like protein/Tfp pilus assembly protein PilF
MPSVVPGYEYDIFISYRHNDNRSGWVTEFVKTLQDELAATIKDSLTVYYDTNPHDGILETHDVDGSLKEKIKSLLFIPIVSQTYCDPKSFAWQKEFLPFVDFVKHDEFGLDIKLNNGNVAKRVLPVRIHEIDEVDKTLFEAQIGGIMRPVDFIYKASGVNRPLNAHEIHPDDNFNRTIYYDQINKVANAIKEIIHTLKSPNQTSTHIHFDEAIATNISQAKPKFKWHLYFTWLVILIASIYGIIFLSSKFGAHTDDKISIAVLPLDDLSGDPEQKYLTAGLHDALIGELGKIQGLRVISRTSTLRYSDKKMFLQDIAKELGVDHIVEGSVVGSGDEVRIQLQLIKVFPEELHIWAQEYRQDLRNVLIMQKEAVKSIADQINVNLTTAEKFHLSDHTTVNADAYKAYQKGMFHWERLTEEDLNIALSQFELAQKIDPDFALAYAGIAMVWVGRFQQGLAPHFEGGPKLKAAATKALELDSTLSDIHSILGSISCWVDWDYQKAAKEYRHAIRLNSNNSFARAYYSHVLNILHRPEEALEQINIAMALDPFNPLYQALYGMDLVYAREYDKAINLLESTLEYKPDDPVALSTLKTTYHMKGMTNEALSVWKKSFIIKNDLKALEALSRGEKIGGYKGALKHLAEFLIDRSDSVYVTPYQVATLYTRAGMTNEAIEWLEKAYYAHDNNMPHIGIDPIFEILSNDPRYINLLRRMNLDFN